MPVPRVALLTIGQSPRPDLCAAILQALPRGVEAMQVGLLDGLDTATVAARFPVRLGDFPLLTRLREGEAVSIGSSAVESGLQRKIEDIEAAGIERIVLLCTGCFPTLRTQRAWLVEPDRVVVAQVAALAGDRRLGLVVPMTSQIREAPVKWADALSVDPLCAAASPYDSTDQLVDAGLALERAGAEALVLDCMGYGEAHRAALAQVSGLPVFVSAMVLAGALAPLL